MGSSWTIDWRRSSDSLGQNRLLDERRTLSWSPYEMSSLAALVSSVAELLEDRIDVATTNGVR
jgi:hypothetical protein